MRLIIGIPLGFEMILVPQEGLHDGSQLGQVLLQIEINSPITLNLPILLPIIHDLLRFVGIESFRIHRTHRLRHPRTSDGNHSRQTLMETLGITIELLAELLLAFKHLLLHTVALHFLFKNY